MNGVGVLSQAHHDVVRLDVPVNVVHLMHVLYSLQQLVEEHQGGLQAEFLTAKIEQVLKTGPKQVSDQEDELVLHGNSLFDEFWEPDTLQCLEILDLSEQLRKLLI